MIYRAFNNPFLSQNTATSDDPRLSYIPGITNFFFFLVRFLGMVTNPSISEVSQRVPSPVTQQLSEHSSPESEYFGNTNWIPECFAFGPPPEQPPLKKLRTCWMADWGPLSFLRSMTQCRPPRVTNNPIVAQRAFESTISINFNSLHVMSIIRNSISFSTEVFFADLSQRNSTISQT